MFFCRHWDRLWVVLHFSSGIVERANRNASARENHPTREVAFSRVGDFCARSRFARSTIPEEKWGTTRSLALRTRTMKNWVWRCKFKHKILVKKDFSRSKVYDRKKSIRSTSQVIRKNPTLSAAKHKTKLWSLPQRSLLMPVEMSFSSIRVKHYISSQLLTKGTKRTSTVAYCKLKKWLTWCLEICRKKRYYKSLYNSTFKLTDYLLPESTPSSDVLVIYAWQGTVNWTSNFQLSNFQLYFIRLLVTIDWPAK